MVTSSQATNKADAQLECNENVSPVNIVDNASNSVAQDIFVAWKRLARYGDF